MLSQVAVLTAKLVAEACAQATMRFATSFSSATHKTEAFKSSTFDCLAGEVSATLTASSPPMASTPFLEGRVFVAVGLQASGRGRPLLQTPSALPAPLLE